jgi:hypothetical protein
VIARRLVAVLIPLACSVAHGATLHTDDFQTGTATLGWGGGASPTYLSTGGPAGAGDAFLQISTFPGGNLATYNLEPNWTGDFTSIGAATISADLMAPTTSAPLPIRLVLMGPTSKYIRWDSVNYQTVPNDGIWRHYTFSLAASDLVQVRNDVGPIGTYANLMADVDHVMFRYDPDAPSDTGTGVDDPNGGTLNLDNITLAAAATPLPGDFNGDGHVNGADLTDPTSGFKARFGVDLDGSDFLVWQRNVGASSTTVALAVPEPAGWIVAIYFGSALAAAANRARRVARFA